MLTATLDATLRKHRTILGNAIVGIEFVRERVVLRRNRAWAELLGYTPRALEGQPTRISKPGLDKDTAAHREGHALEPGCALDGHKAPSLGRPKAKMNCAQKNAMTME
jgi:PAS domain-containing protein